MPKRAATTVTEHHFPLITRGQAMAHSLRKRVDGFLARRPHRSFRRTRRRDYRRSLVLPGYVAFTKDVLGVLWVKRRLFGTLILIYAIMTIVLGGITSQDTYSQISDLIKQGNGTAVWGSIGDAAILLASAFAGGSGTLTADQQVYLGLLLILAWLTTVWLLREVLAGKRPKFRDGLYSAGAPLVSTVLVFIVALLQLLPIGIVALIYAGLSSVGLLDGGFGLMLFSLFAALVATLTLYWMTSTFIGMVVVTLPGMYPIRALRSAGDLVVGRRLRILYRIVWLAVTILLTWVLIMIPIILLDTWIKSIWPAIASVPIAPLFASLTASLTIVFSATYIYLLYRRVIDDDARPA